MKKTWIYIIFIILALCCLIYYISTGKNNIRKDNINLSQKEVVDNIDWINFNLFEFTVDEIKSIAYIKDRSNLGVDTNLCWYIEDKEDIQAIFDSIETDISFIGYNDPKNISMGDAAIVLWITLVDNSVHKVIYFPSRLIYEEIEYAIIPYQKLLENAWKNILSEYKPKEIIGIDYPPEDIMKENSTT